MILLLAPVAGILLGLFVGGSFRGLADVRLRGEYVLLGLLILQAVLPAISAAGLTRQALYWCWVATFPLMVGVCVANLKYPGMAIAAAGLALNGTVVLLNGGMPVLPNAVAQTGGTLLAFPPSDYIHVMFNSLTRAPWLADVLPVSGPPGIRGVASPGDVLLACGVATVLLRAMRSYRQSEFAIAKENGPS